MKQLLITFLYVSIFGALLFVGNEVFAGGCCYRSFSSTKGIAGKQDAEINVAFVDPRIYLPNADKNMPKYLANQKIAIHIKSPQEGQSCWMASEYTDSDGHTEARCRSVYAGTIQIYFSAPDLDSQSNQSIGYATREIVFDGDVYAPPATPTPTTVVAPITTNTPKPVETFDASGQAQTKEVAQTEVLQQRVADLEKQVSAQEKEVGVLRGLLEKLLKIIGGFFSSNN